MIAKKKKMLAEKKDLKGVLEACNLVDKSEVGEFPCNSLRSCLKNKLATFSHQKLTQLLVKLVASGCLIARYRSIDHRGRRYDALYKLSDVSRE